MRHIRYKHSTKRFTCYICGYIYKHHQDFSNHMRHKHGEMPIAVHSTDLKQAEAIPTDRLEISNEGTSSDRLQISSEDEMDISTKQDMDKSLVQASPLLKGRLKNKLHENDYLKEAKRRKSSKSSWDKITEDVINSLQDPEVQMSTKLNQVPTEVDYIKPSTVQHVDADWKCLPQPSGFVEVRMEETDMMQISKEETLSLQQLSLEYGELMQIGAETFTILNEPDSQVNKETLNDQENAGGICSPCCSASSSTHSSIINRSVQTNHTDIGLFNVKCNISTSDAIENPRHDSQNKLLTQYVKPVHLLVYKVPVYNGTKVVAKCTVASPYMPKCHVKAQPSVIDCGECNEDEKYPNTRSDGQETVLKVGPQPSMDFPENFLQQSRCGVRGINRTTYLQMYDVNLKKLKPEASINTSTSGDIDSPEC